MTDRLVEHAEVMALDRDSYRLEDRDLGRAHAAATDRKTTRGSRAARAASLRGGDPPDECIGQCCGRIWILPGEQPTVLDHARTPDHWGLLVPRPEPLQLYL